MKILFRYLFVVTTIIACSVPLSAQFIQELDSEIVIVCEEQGVTFSAAVINTAATRTAASLQVCLGIGQEYLAGSLVSVSGPSLTHDPASPDNAPIFLVDSWASGTVLEFTFSKQAGCDARQARIDGELFADTLKFFDNMMPVMTTGADNTTDYEVLYGELTTAVTSTAPAFVTTLGQTVTRRVTITNGSFGYLDSLTFGEIDASGEIAYSNFVLDPDGAGINLGDGVISGATVSVDLGSTELDAVFANGLLENNESIVIEYDMEVNSCSNSGVTTQVFSNYGCFGEVCQGDTTVASVGVLLDQPDIEINSVQIVSNCYGYDEAPDTFRVTLTNVGAGDAIDLSLLYRVARTEFGGIDTMNMQYSVDGAPSVDIAATTFFATRGAENTNRFGCEAQEPSLGVGNLANFGVDLRFPDTLPPGSQLTVQMLYYKCCPVSCVQDQWFGFARYGGINSTETRVGYNNVCENNLIARNLPGISRFFSYGNTISLPTTFFPGDVKPGQIDFQRLSGTADLSSEDGYLEIKAELPDCIDASSLQFVRTDGMTGMTSSRITQDSFIFRINLPDGGFDLDGSILKFDLLIDCDEVCINDNFTYTVVWVPSTSADCVSDCELILACETFPIARNCPAPCEGAAYRSYDFLRTNIGAFDMDDNGCPDNDNDCDGVPGGGPVAPAPEMDSLALNRAIRGDTVSSLVTLVISDTMPIQGFDFLYSQDELDLTVFTPIGSTIMVFPADGSGPFTQDDVDSQIAGNIVGYDLSPGQVPAWLPANNEYVNGDSVVFEAFYIVGATGTSVAQLYEIGNQIAVTNQMNATLTEDFVFDDVEDFVCGNVAGSMLVNDLLLVSTGNSIPIITGCQSRNFSGNYRLELSPGVGAGLNYFPREYRNLFTPELIQVVIPPGFAQDSSEVRIERTAGNGGQVNSAFYTLTPTGTTTEAGFTVFQYDLTDPANTDLFDLVAFPSDDGFTVNVRSFATPTCEADGTFTTNSIAAENRNILTGTTFDGEIFSSIQGFSGEFIPPSLQANTTAPTQIGTGPTVTWPLTINNASAISDADNVWLSLRSPDGTVGNDSLSIILDRGGTPVTLSPDANGFYRLADYPALSDSTFTITASYENCSSSEFEVLYGWNCGKYPMSLDDLEDLCVDTLTLRIVPQRAALSLNVTPLAQTPADPSMSGGLLWDSSDVTICEPFPVEIRLVSGAQGFVIDPNLSIFNPAGGGTVGLEYVLGSGYVEYPVGTAPRQFDATADADIFAQNGEISWDFSLADVDPTVIGGSSDSLLPGVTDIPNNQVIVRLLLQATCDISSGERFRVAASGEEICGQLARGSGERSLGFPILIEGTDPPYINTLTVNALDSLPLCTDMPLDVDFGLIHFGAAASNRMTDSITIILPPYATGDFSNISCNPALTFCPVLPPRVFTRPDGVTEVIYALPNGMTNMDTLGFSVEVDISDTIGCVFPNGQVVEFQSMISTEVFCDDIMMNCPNFQVINGSALDSFRTFQPNVRFDDVMVNCLQGGDFIIGAEITVDSFPVLAGDSLVINLYCLDENGDPEPDPSADFTVQGPIDSGMTVTLNEVFSATCDPANGVQLRIEREDNCVCTEAVVNSEVVKCPFVEITGPEDATAFCVTKDIALSAEAFGDFPANAVWSTDGGGVLTDPTSLNTTYEIVPEDGGKTITFTLTTQPAADIVCPPFADSIMVRIVNVDCGDFFWDGNE